MIDRNDQEKSLSTMNKTITIKEHILNYAKNERYFNINDLRNYFNEKKIDYKNDILKKYVEKMRTMCMSTKSTYATLL